MLPSFVLFRRLKTCRDSFLGLLDDFPVMSSHASASDPSLASLPPGTEIIASSATLSTGASSSAGVPAPPNRGGGAVRFPTPKRHAATSSSDWMYWVLVLVIVVGVAVLLFFSMKPRPFVLSRELHGEWTVRNVTTRSSWSLRSSFARGASPPATIASTSSVPSTLFFQLQHLFPSGYFESQMDLSAAAAEVADGGAAPPGSVDFGSWRVSLVSPPFQQTFAASAAVFSWQGPCQQQRGGGGDASTITPAATCELSFHRGSLLFVVYPALTFKQTVHDANDGRSAGILPAIPEDYRNVQTFMLTRVSDTTWWGQHRVQIAVAIGLLVFTGRYFATSLRPSRMAQALTSRTEYRQYLERRAANAAVAVSK